MTALTTAEKIEYLKHADGTLTDTECNLLLRQAEEIIVQRCYPYMTDYSTAEMHEKYSMLQVEIAIELRMKEGAEGEKGHDENGINRKYENASVSESLLKRITPYAHVIGYTE